jgi:hypothetical protein
MRKPKLCMIKIKHDLVKTYDYKSQKEHETNLLDKMWNKLNNNALAAFQCCSSWRIYTRCGVIKKKLHWHKIIETTMGLCVCGVGSFKRKTERSIVTRYKSGAKSPFSRQVVTECSSDSAILILCRFKLQFAKENLTERLTKIRARIVGCRARNVEL